ncbi:hypothetical protein BGZ83_010384 [Gryganskiella cystojenkinii]|nr:hypothetical protein BGZ83_010384 [Gryganskiella cystojenkinii]
MNLKNEAANDVRALVEPERQDIERRLQGLSQVPKDAVLNKVNDLTQRINTLRQLITDMMAALSPTDARICLEGVKTLSDQLAVLRVQLVPKPKFRFKSRAMLTNNRSGSNNSMTTGTAVPASSPSLLAVATAIAEDDSLMEVDSSPLSSLTFDNHTDTQLSIESLFSSSTLLGQQPQQRGQPLSPRNINLSNMTNCTVNLTHKIPLPVNNVRLKNLKRCLVVIPLIPGHVFVQDCVGSTLIGACHQLQLHNSKDMDLYIESVEESVIDDDCSELKFGSYPRDDIQNATELQRLFDGLENRLTRQPFKQEAIAGQAE